ncbi:hypothetical protein GJAV_G00221140 [Gymnothorax javanicus]|nr:hypothetical protein GJAV_G00221140 [Gymnothorax javanicus]
MLGTLCTLISVLSCISGQKVLTQKPTVLSVNAQQKATMDCNIALDHGNRVSWYKQVPGSAPQYVLRTKLIVIDSSLPAPTLSLLPPSSEELKTEKATLVCLAQMSVGFADVSWTSGGSPVTDGIITSTAQQKPDKTFGLSSFLTIKPSEWISDRAYTCKVSFGSKATEKSIKKSDCSE